MEQQLPNWLAAAIDAAGLCTVYNADDWNAITATGLMPLADPDPEDPPQIH